MFACAYDERNHYASCYAHTAIMVSRGLPSGVVLTELSLKELSFNIVNIMCVLNN